MPVITIAVDGDLPVSDADSFYLTGVPYEAKTVDLMPMEPSDYDDSPSPYKEYALTYALKHPETGEIQFKTESVSMNFRTGQTKVYKLLYAMIGRKVSKEHLPKDEKGRFLFDTDLLLNQSVALVFSHNKQGKITIAERSPITTPKTITDDECKNPMVAEWAIRRKKDDTAEILDIDTDLFAALAEKRDGPITEATSEPASDVVVPPLNTGKSKTKVKKSALEATEDTTSVDVSVDAVIPDDLEITDPKLVTAAEEKPAKEVKAVDTDDDALDVSDILSGSSFESL